MADSSAALLRMLVDEEVIRILKSRLTPEQIADLVMESINPYRPLGPSAKAALAGVTERALRDRRARGAK